LDVLGFVLYPPALIPLPLHPDSVLQPQSLSLIAQTYYFLQHHVFLPTLLTTPIISTFDLESSLAQQFDEGSGGVSLQDGSTLGINESDLGIGVAKSISVEGDHDHANGYLVDELLDVLLHPAHLLLHHL
jgi:hypothetical protein